MSRKPTAPPIQAGRRRPENDRFHLRHRRRRRRHASPGTCPAKSMNVLTDEGIAELDAASTRALADPAVKGIVITSAKAGLRRRHGPERAGADEGGGRRRPGARPLRRHHGDPPPAAQDRARRHGPEDPEGRQAGRLGRCPAPPPASAPRSASPATAASWPTTPRPRSACPRSSSASSPAPAAPPAYAACSA